MGGLHCYRRNTHTYIALRPCAQCVHRANACFNNILGLVGFLDDYIKVFKKTKKG